MRASLLYLVGGLSSQSALSVSSTKNFPKVTKTKVRAPQNTTKTQNVKKVVPTPKKTKTEENKKPPRMPKWSPLYWDTNFFDYFGGYAVTYNRYFVGVHEVSSSAAHNNNDKWWQWSFDNRYQTAGGTYGFSKDKINNKDDLRNACKQAYLGFLDGSEGSVIISSQDYSTKYLESDIWKYCSPAEEKLVLLSDNTGDQEYDHNTYGNKYKYDLVSLKSESKGNKWFWEYEERKFVRNNNHHLLVGARDFLKHICEAAYNAFVPQPFPLDPDTTFRYCSISGIAPDEFIGVKKEPKKRVDNTRRSNLFETFGIGSMFGTLFV